MNSLSDHGNNIPFNNPTLSTENTNDLNKIEKVKMKKSLSLINSITIIVGSVIGSGIFVSPTGILMNVNSVGLSLIIWFLCGLYSLLGAWCYAALGTLIEKSGGDYIYVYYAFGPFFGFLRLWVEVMVARPTSIAIVAMTFAKYFVKPFYPTCDEHSSLLLMWAIICIGKNKFINFIFFIFYLKLFL